MSLKWSGFGMAAATIVALGIGSTLSGADEKETPLGKLMEKVQKHNITITKATRTVAAFKKGQSDVVKSAKELAKLAKESKPLNDAVKNAKGEPDAAKKWDEIMEAFAKTSLALAEEASKSDAEHKAVKDSFNKVKKTCSDCHTVFRIDSE